MSTTIFTRKTNTIPSAPTGYYDMSATNSAVAGLAANTTARTDVAPDPRPFQSLAFGVPIAFWSERVAADVTISGPITFSASAYIAAGFTNIRLRVGLYKITAGGSNVETFIGQADATADLTTTTTTLYSFSFTPVVPVTVVVNERFIMRPMIFTTAGSYAAGDAHFNFGSITANQQTTVTFTEAVTFKTNGTTLFTRRTTTIGIGSFLDLLLTRGSTANTTGIVNTAASGTEIQWTRTAGGTLLEFISPRLKAPGWTPFSTASFIPKTSAVESNASANCSIRAKVFRRQPDGTETLVYQAEFSIELVVGASDTQRTLSTNPVFTPTNFAEDDRIVFRVYIINVGTMAAGFTCTFGYDHNVNAGNGDSILVLLDMPDFKLESDPAGTARIEGGLTLGGIGN